jgi:hypothetical protein
MTSSTALYDDIGGRLFKGYATEGTEYPYVVIQIVSDVPDLTFTESYDDILIQFSLFSSASSSGEVEDMFAHLKELYDECSMSIPAISHDKANTLVWMKRVNAILMVEDEETPEGTRQIFHYAVDYEIKTQL